MPRVVVNGTELYYEIRGAGPPVLLIMGATGDGGHFDALADVLPTSSRSSAMTGAATGAVPPRTAGRRPRQRSRPMMRRACWMSSGPGLRRCSARAAAVCLRCV